MEVTYIGIILAFIASIHGATIDVQPSNMTVAVGDNANMTCECSGDVSDDKLTWREHITTLVGAKIFDSDMSGPNDPNDYDIVGEYNLVVRKVELNDGGIYSCGLEDQKSPYNANLVILEEPEIAFLPSLEEGKTYEMRCVGRYGGSPLALSGPNNIPSMRASVANRIFVDSDPELLVGPLPGPPYQVGTFGLTFNYTAHGSDNGMMLKCESMTKEPAFSVGKSFPLDIKYATTGIRLSVDENRRSFYVGEEIVCEADGNPDPTIKWTAITSPGPRSVSSGTLEITEAMIGDNEWICQAFNEPNGISEPQTKAIKFEVLTATVPPNTAYQQTASFVTVCLSFVSLLFI